MNQAGSGQPVTPYPPLALFLRYRVGMRILIAVLIILLLSLNILLWKFNDRGVRQVRSLEAAIEAQKAENAALAERNSALEAEVKSLKEGLEAIEERARADMGMIRKGETFYYMLEDSPAKITPEKLPPRHE